MLWKKKYIIVNYLNINYVPICIYCQKLLKLQNSVINWVLNQEIKKIIIDTNCLVFYVHNQ